MHSQLTTYILQTCTNIHVLHMYMCTAVCTQIQLLLCQQKVHRLHTVSMRWNCACHSVYNCAVCKNTSFLLTVLYVLSYFPAHELFVFLLLLLLQCVSHLWCEVVFNFQTLKHLHTYMHRIYQTFLMQVCRPSQTQVKSMHLTACCIDYYTLLFLLFSTF